MPEGGQPIERFVGELTSAEGIFDAITDDIVTDAMRNVEDLPDIQVPLPIIRGLGFDDLFGRLLTFPIDTSKITRTAGRILGDFSVPVLGVVGGGLTIGPNLYENIKERAPWHETTSDLFIDG